MSGAHFALDRPAMSAKVTALVLDGNSDQEVALAISTPRRRWSRQAITAFRLRHRDTLGRARQAIAEAAEQFAISSKVERLRDLQDLRDRMWALLNDRGGLEVEDTKIAANGMTVTVKAFDAALVREMRGVLDDAAKEMGERKAVIDARSQTFNYIALVQTLGGTE